MPETNHAADKPSNSMVNILLVDDQPANLIALEGLLEGLGQNLIRAHSGEEALRHLLRTDFAVILLDVRMPRMDGFETAQLIRGRDRSRHTPIIFLTAFDTNDFPVDRAYALGAVDYLVKPLVPEILRAKVSVFVELSQLRAKQEAAQREQWRVTLSSIGDAVIVTDSRGRVTFLNPVAQALTGWKPEEAEGEDLEKVLPLFAVETRSPVENPARQALWKGSPVGPAGYTLLRARSGTEKLVDPSAAPIRDGRGITGAVLVFRDVTERWQNEQALREANRRRDETLALLDSLLRHAPIGFAFFDREHRFVRINQFLADVNGLPVPAHLGRPVREVLPANAPAVESVLDEVFRTGTPVRSREVSGETPAAPGELRHWLANFYPVHTPDGQTPWVGAVVLDITEQKRLEGEIRQHAQDLAEHNRRKDEFLAMLGHELRNPLAPLRNAAQVLRLTGADPALLPQLQDVVDRQVRQLTRLVDDLLDMSRINQGKIELRKEPVDLAAVVSRAVEATRPLLDERQHQLSVALPPLPLPLMADPARLEQVVTNLLNNAAKYTPPGGRIDLTVETRSGAVVLRVRDNGIGIRPELLPYIFDLFQQADSVPGRVREGLGIGLTLVHRLLEMHGGSVEVRSPGPGKGSEFIIRLPLEPIPPSPAPSPPVGGEGGEGVPSPPLRGEGKELPPSPPVGGEGRGGGAGGGQPLSVLIVDDNQDAAESMALLLRLGGHDVRVVHDGPAGLEAAASSPPEVVLLDIGLPKGMDGYDVARRLRARPAMGSALLIALTGYGQEEDRRRAREAGFDAHLVKPVDPDALRELLAQHRGRRPEAAGGAQH